MTTVKDFSVEEKLIALLTLQKIDSKGDEIKTLKGELPMEVKDLEDEIAGLQTRIANIDAEIESIDAFIEKENDGKKEAGNHIKDAQFEQTERRAGRTRTEERIAVLEEAAAGKRTELEKIIADTEKEEKKLTKESNAAKEHVDPRMLSAYERIRNSYPNGLAVVPVLRDSCGGCFNVIPPQRQSEIRQRKKIVVCEHCGRILVDNDLNDSVKVKV
jgi:predicted  nucleic acid-binding Zn-ribbon protein